MGTKIEWELVVDEVNGNYWEARCGRFEFEVSQNDWDSWCVRIDVPISRGRKPTHASMESLMAFPRLEEAKLETQQVFDEMLAGVSEITRDEEICRTRAELATAEEKTQAANSLLAAALDRAECWRQRFRAMLVCCTPDCSPIQWRDKKIARIEKEMVTAEARIKELEARETARAMRLADIVAEAHRPMTEAEAREAHGEGG